MKPFTMLLDEPSKLNKPFEKVAFPDRIPLTMQAGRPLVKLLPLTVTPRPDIQLNVGGLDKGVGGLGDCGSGGLGPGGMGCNGLEMFTVPAEIPVNP
jgi:hypothetical protein